MADRRCGSTRCSRSAGCSRRAAARRRRCSPARCGSAPHGARASKPGAARRRRRRADGRRGAALRLARRHQARQRARGERARRRRAAAASTSAPRPAASPTACSQPGRPHVVALDVAYGELSWRLRGDPRVTVIERFNARELRADALPYAPELIVVDVSFISLRTVLPARARLRGAALRRAGARQAAVRGRPRAGRPRRRRARRRAAARARCSTWPRRRAALGASVRGFHRSGLPGPEGQPRDVRRARRGRARIARRTSRRLALAADPG